MFGSIIFLVAWGSILIFSWLILRACEVSLSRPTIPSIVYVFYLGFNYLGIPVLYFYMVEHLYNLGVHDRGYVWDLFFMSALCLLLLLLGFLYAKDVLGLKPKGYEAATSETSQEGSLEAVILLSVCLVIFLHYARIAHVIPLVELVKGKVPENIFKRNNEFWVCDSCGKVYWEGGHCRRIKKSVEKIKEKLKA